MDGYTKAVETQANGPLWSAALAVLTILFVVYSAILIYHWFAFSMQRRTALLVTTLYLVIGSVFIISMATSLTVL